MTDIHVQPVLNTEFTVSATIGLVSIDRMFVRLGCYSKEYRAFKDAFSLICKTEYTGLVPIAPPYNVSIVVSTNKDIDNFVKPIYDSIKGLVIFDDKYILTQLITKYPLQFKTDKEKLTLCITSMMTEVENYAGIYKKELQKLQDGPKEKRTTKRRKRS